MVICWWSLLHELVVAGELDLVGRRPTTLWSNRLVLQDFGINDRLKFDPEGKVAFSSETLSLRGRRLEGAVLVGAHLRRADFTGAQLDHVSFLYADLREAKFACELRGEDRICAQMQGADLSGAELQGADLSHARLQGASLDASRLQGASLNGTELTGASLSVAELQGASLTGARLYGASLDFAQLKGALLDSAQLQGASLESAQLETAWLTRAFVWRTKPPKKQYLKGALIQILTVEPKYLCGEAWLMCDWTDAVYSGLRARMENVEYSGGALRRIKLLGEKPYSEDVASAKDWRDLAAKDDRPNWTYYPELATLLIQIGCDANSAPFVIGGLIRQLGNRFSEEVGDGTTPPLPESPEQRAEVARAFLDETSCPGAKGLSEENKAKLREVVSSVKKTPNKAER